MESILTIPFSDTSDSFVHGVEFGRLLGMMECAYPVVENRGFPVHTQNEEVIRSACREHNYVPHFSVVPGMEGWLHFFAIRPGTTEN